MEQSCASRNRLLMQIGVVSGKDWQGYTSFLLSLVLTGERQLIRSPMSLALHVSQRSALQLCFSEHWNSRRSVRPSMRHRQIVTSAQRTCSSAEGSPSSSSQPGGSFSRRAALSAAAAAASTLASLGPASALPLAPLGKVTGVGGDKLVGLPIEEVKDILARDLAEGQYFVTGDLTPEIFADDCRFKDPTNDIVGLSRYKQALGILFDPQYSVVRLRGISVTGPQTIEADWMLGGYLRFPWSPRVEPFEGHTVYTLNDQGLIQVQYQTWQKSAATALLESFTPTSGPKTDIVNLQ